MSHPFKRCKFSHFKRQLKIVFSLRRPGLIGLMFFWIFYIRDSQMVKNALIPQSEINAGVLYRSNNQINEFTTYDDP